MWWCFLWVWRKYSGSEKIKFAIENNLVYTAGNDYHYDNCLNHGDLLELSIEGKPLEKFIERVFKES